MKNKMTFYKKIDIAKDGSKIPYFFNEKPMFSQYNPERDALRFTEDLINLEKNTAIFIAGIGTAQHINLILENPKITIVFALENDKNTLNQIKDFIPNSKKLILCTINDFSNKIINNYIPQLHGNFLFKPLKSWILAFKEFNPEFNESDFQASISNIIKTISRDIATQSFFGKIWHKNILKNIYLFSKITEKKLFATIDDFDLQKTAAIIGASPILDEEIKILKNHREDFFIFSTDTSFQVLAQYGIKPDAVVTLDGQPISAKHFHCKPDSILIADFCSNSSIIEKFLDINCKIALTNSGHPLSSLFDFWLFEKYKQKSIYKVSAGNGTVLQLALDFAFSAGFTKYKILGGEFAYTKHKAYCKGTYFDFIFNFSSTKITSTENSYTKLFYSNKIIVDEKLPTTENLKSYKDYLMEYLKNKQYSQNQNITKLEKFSSKAFFIWYIDKLKKNDEIIKNSLLPLLAWINKCKKNSDTIKEALFITEKMLSSFNIEE